MKGLGCMKDSEFRGEWITLDVHNGIHVPSNPNVGFIEGDGTGPDIWAAARPVFDAAVQKAYAGNKKDCTGLNFLRAKGP